MKIKEINSEEIIFDNGIVIGYEHYQDCCEHVYADFESLKYSSILNHNFGCLSIEDVPDFGIKLNGFPIPCYNDQNGYYSDDLQLIIKYPNNPIEIRLEISKKDMMIQ